MAIIFPVAASVFADVLKIQSVTWRLREFTETSGTAIGQVLTAITAPAKWSAEIAIAPAYHADANRVAALFEAIGATGTFHLHNPAAAYPADDPDGSIIGSTVPRVDTVGTNNKSLRLKDLPPAYQLRAGDMIQISSGARRMLLRVAEDALASAGGVTPLFEVRPHLRTWVAANLNVSLKQPHAIMRFAGYEPGAAAPRITSGAGFEAIEVY